MVGKQFQQGKYILGSWGARQVNGILGYLGQASRVCVSKNRERGKQQLASLGESVPRLCRLASGDKLFWSIPWGAPVHWTHKAGSPGRLHQPRVLAQEPVLVIKVQPLHCSSRPGKAKDHPQCPQCHQASVPEPRREHTVWFQDQGSSYTFGFFNVDN